MRQCIFVIGTRAQLVKIAPVLRLAHECGLRHTVWFTGQHHESIDDLVHDFGLQSKFERPVKRREHSSILSLAVWIPSTVYRCFRYVSSVKTWTGKRPLVIVHGDTLSTWFGAVAGSWGGGDIVHLESGLSSGRWNEPFPEELLRRLTFRRTRYALCPNADAAERMRRYSGCIVVDTGENTLLDCVRYAIADIPNSDESEKRSTFVVSIHRFQNIYSRTALTMIVDEVLEAADFGPVQFILHPPTERRLNHYGLFEKLARHNDVELMSRKPYTVFVAMLQRARAVLTDGGSNQEELSYLGVPTILYRDRSERPDGIGGNIVFRKDLRGSLGQFIESGSLDQLRSTCRLTDAVQPSQMTVEALLRWAGIAGGSAQSD